MLFQRSIESPSAATSVAGERALIERAKALDGDAWEELFHAHHGGLRRFLAYRLRDPDAADDLASQVFVEAIAGIDRYVHRGIPIRAWLFRIARNICADHLRRHARRPAPWPTVDAGEDPLDAVERESERRQLLTAMEELNDEQREVLALRFFEGLTTLETATAMSKSAGAIKAMQHRALARMRRSLAVSR